MTWTLLASSMSQTHPRLDWVVISSTLHIDTHMHLWLLSDLWGRGYTFYIRVRGSIDYTQINSHVSDNMRQMYVQVWIYRWHNMEGVQYTSQRTVVWKREWLRLNNTEAKVTLCQRYSESRTWTHVLRYTCTLQCDPIQQLCHKLCLIKHNKVQFWLTLSQRF